MVKIISKIIMPEISPKENTIKYFFIIVLFVNIYESHPFSFCFKLLSFF